MSLEPYAVSGFPVILDWFGKCAGRVIKWFGWFSSPCLKVSLNNSFGELSTDGARYHHLRVDNKKGWVKASKVRVELTRLYRKDSGGVWQIVYEGNPFQMPWQNYGVNPQEIDGQQDYLCDFGALKQGERFGFGLFITNCRPEVNPWVTVGNPLRAEVVAVGENARSHTAIIEVSWDGRWEQGALEMSKHLVLRQIK
ncbi:MAG: hypothetical protein U0894_01455 [Pirellulales bacterium]